MLCILLFVSLSIQGQIDNEQTSKLQQEEREIIKKIHVLSNTSGKKAEAYLLVHKELRKKKRKSARFQADLSFILTTYFRNKSQIDSAKHYAKNILKLQKFKNDTIKNNILGLAYYNLGSIDHKIGLNEKSKKWHLKGIEISRIYNDKRIYYVNAFSLANVYLATTEYDLALGLLKECQNYTDNEEIVFGSLVNLATIYGYREEHDTSIEYLEKAREICEKTNRTRCIGTILVNLGINYKKTGNLDQALLSFNNALNIAKTHNYDRMEIIGSVEKGRLLSELKKYDDAEKIMLAALSKAKNLGFLNEQAKIYLRLKEVAVSQSNHKKALRYYEKYYTTIDSTRALDKDKEINELEVKYKTLQKEKEIQFLQIENTNRNLELINREKAIRNLKLEQEIKQKENEIEKKESENMLLSFQSTTEKTLKNNIILKKNQELKDAQLKIQLDETERQKGFKNIILYSFLILLIPVIGLLITYYQKIKVQSELTKKQEEINEAKITSLLKEKELKVIKASIEAKDKERTRIAQELHDSIGGNLAAIKLQLNNSDPSQNGTIRRINSQIDDTYELVRNLSHNLIPKKFSKNNFCDLLQEYFNNISSSSNLKTSFSPYPSKEINFLSEHIQVEIFKIIQELVTNTIKHAKASAIEVQLNLVANALNILFEDDGVGFDIHKNKEGIGFRNIRSRLDKISGIINIDSRIQRGTIINIEITNLTTTINEIQPNYS